MSKGSALPFLLTLCMTVTSCQPSTTSTLLPVQIERARAEQLLSFYFGSYTERTPSAEGLIHIDGDEILVDVKKLNALQLSATLEDVNNDGIIDWDELEPFLISTYYEARNIPPTLEALYTQIGEVHPDSSGWMAIEIDGMMVSARRQVLVQSSAIHEALSAYIENNHQILYPIGTTFVGHHYNNGQLVETTISQKRFDDFWDFFIYDQQGKLTSATQTGPKELVAPTRCVGCHFGTKLFEPEASFPDQAPDGPFGPRGIYVEDLARNQTIASQLDEHTKRSDTILGVYATIYASRLQAKLEMGEDITEEEQSILDAIRP